MKWLFIGLIRLYQLTLSPWLGQHCRFYPSCSVYCLEALRQHGAWRGLWLGLKTGRQAGAIVWTVCLVNGVPWLASILCSVLFAGLNGLHFAWGSLPFWIMVFVPHVIVLTIYLALIRLARQRLMGELAGAEVVQLDLGRFISSAARNTASAFRKARHWTPT